MSIFTTMNVGWTDPLTVSTSPNMVVKSRWTKQSVNAAYVA